MGEKSPDECFICGYRGNFYECPQCAKKIPYDKVVCQWSTDFGVALTEKQLNALVDRLAEMLEGI